MKKFAVIAVAGLSAACATSPRSSDVMVTVPFDRSDYDRVEVYATAQSQCKAKGYKVAKPAAEQPTNTSGTFGHQAFMCERF